MRAEAPGAGEAGKGVGPAGPTVVCAEAAPTDRRREGGRSRGPHREAGRLRPHPSNGNPTQTAVGLVLSAGCVARNKVRSG